ncbi:MAG TPA: M23 family metallopeptidase [Acidimicrobiales bacterium]|nr:M23 family metallopeptidase [Acidimicrobiales bacterium]
MPGSQKLRRRARRSVGRSVAAAACALVAATLGGLAVPSAAWADPFTAPGGGDQTASTPMVPVTGPSAPVAPAGTGAGAGTSTPSTPGGASLDSQDGNLGYQEVALLDQLYAAQQTEQQAARAVADTAARIAALRPRLEAASASVTAATAQAGASRARLAADRARLTQARATLRAQAVDDYIDPPQLDNLATMIGGGMTEFLDRPVYSRTAVDASAKLISQVASVASAAQSEVARLTSLEADARRGAATVAAEQTGLASLQQTQVAAEQADATKVAAVQAAVDALRAQRVQVEARIATLGGGPDGMTSMVLSAQGAAPAGWSRPMPGQVRLVLPLPGAPITSPYGPRVDPISGAAGFHPGIDFGASSGTPIRSAVSGRVVWAGPVSGYGNTTVIDAGDMVATLYAHQTTIGVQVGQVVQAGQVIGTVGSTGYSTGPHLHFEIRIEGVTTDPFPYLVEALAGAGPPTGGSTGPTGD